MRTNPWIYIHILAGAIPHEIGNLHNLEMLYLSSNSLTGLIPSKIFNISTMKYIALASNNLSGELPPTIGLWLPNLEGLYLGGNKLSGVIPSSISNASKLAILDLGVNSFTGFIPDTLGNLRLLEWLNVEHNSLTRESSTLELRFFTSLTNCKYLRSLLLSYNLLNGRISFQFPSGIFQLLSRDFMHLIAKLRAAFPKK